VSRFVVKVGGAVAAEAARAVLPLAEEGHEVCVVHGAGPQITAEMERRGLPVRFVGGRRATSAAALAVVREALLRMNADLCAAIGPRALGLAGDEIGLRAVRLPGLGLVGDPLPSRPAAVRRAFADGLVPVVAPIAVGDRLRTSLAAYPQPVPRLNVNADDAATALAVGLGADRILFVTDVPGVLLDDAVVAQLEAAEADRLLGDGTFAGGIVPKLQAAVRAARLGVFAEIGETAVVP
jgi:acetylglutamate kinase